MSTFSDLMSYLATPTVILSYVGSAIYVGRKIGSFEERFKSVENKVDKVSSKTSKLFQVTEQLNNCINEIQTLLKSNFSFTLTQQTINLYGEAHSPISLRDEFLPLIVNSGLDKEIQQKKKLLVEWLESKHPQTGLDAQEFISELVASKEIETLIDTTNFRQVLYEKGKSSQDYIGILAIYLFQVLIPEVIKQDSSA